MRGEGPCEIVNLYSGSSGNCTLFRLRNRPDSCVLVDAGRSARRLCMDLAESRHSLELLQAVFVTHEHIDHVSALNTLIRKHPMPVHAPSAVVDLLLPDASRALRDCLVPHTPFSEVTVGGFTVKSFPTPHDSVMSVGYRLEFRDAQDAEKVRAVGIATDLGCITRDVYEGLAGCEAVCVESNHDVLMLQCGNYPQKVKNRILSGRGHLSNEDSVRLVGALSQTGTRRVMLCHLSAENNNPDLAFRTMAAAVGDVMQIAVAGEDRLCWMPEERRPC